MWGLICLFSFILTTVFMSAHITKANAAEGISRITPSPGDWSTFMGNPGHSG